jgi:hypothetical protein
VAELSPAARAIVAAFNERYELCGPFDDDWVEQCLAAALRAAADHLGSCNASTELLTLATELEAQ